MDSHGDWIGRQEARKARREFNRAAFRAKKLDDRSRLDSRRAMRRLGTWAENETDKKGRRMDTPDPRLLPDDQLVELVNALMHVDKYDWKAHRRADQIPPDDFIIWLLLAGRGHGKTRTSAETVREACETPNTRVAVIAKDHRALRDVCFEGVSGLIACIPPDEVQHYNKGLGDVGMVLKNGSVIKGYTSEAPDAIRGQSFNLIWGDEFAAWPLNKAEDMLTQARMCLRESENARAILSTTPKRVPHVVNMVKLAADPVEKIVITKGRSRDNTALSEEWHRQMERTYGGTSMGRQELEGELVMDNEHALWSGRLIDEAQFAEDEMPQMVGVVTGVDPSGSKDGDATGIVTVGWDRDKVLYVLDNRTCNGTPAERYTAVCLSVMQWGAGEIVYETSYGGDNCKFGIEQQWKNLQHEGVIPEDRRCPMIVGSKIKGDKAARAMPVVALYEQQVNIPDRRRIWHLPATEQNQIAALAEEQLTWETNSTKSPNAIDACVHACRRVMQKTGQEASFSSPASPHSTRKENGGTGTRRIGGGYRVW